MAYREVKWCNVFENDNGGWCFSVIKGEIEVNQPAFSNYDYLEPEFISPVYHSKSEAVTKMVQWMEDEWDFISHLGESWEKDTEDGSSTEE